MRLRVAACDGEEAPLRVPDALAHTLALALSKGVGEGWAKGDWSTDRVGQPCLLGPVFFF